MLPVAGTVPIATPGYYVWMPDTYWETSALRADVAVSIISVHYNNYGNKTLFVMLIYTYLHIFTYTVFLLTNAPLQ